MVQYGNVHRHVIRSDPQIFRENTFLGKLSWSKSNNTENHPVIWYKIRFLNFHRRSRDTPIPFMRQTLESWAATEKEINASMFFENEKTMASPFVFRRYPRCTVAIQRNLILGKHCPCKPAWRISACALRPSKQNNKPPIGYENNINKEKHKYLYRCRKRERTEWNTI